MLDVLVIDLDGTIVDCAARHHACYAELAREHGCRALDARTYWNMKRARAPWESIIGPGCDDADVIRFTELFVERIEQPQYLALDSLYPGALDALRALRAMASLLLLVTMRRNPQQLGVELNRLGVAPLFDRMIARGPDANRTKGDLAAPLVPAGARRIAWIGDTEEDIAGARTVGATACAVWSGLRERRLLERERPDLIAADLAEAATVLGSPAATGRGNPA